MRIAKYHARSHLLDFVGCEAKQPHLCTRSKVQNARETRVVLRKILWNLATVRTCSQQRALGCTTGTEVRSDCNHTQNSTVARSLRACLPALPSGGAHQPPVARVQNLDFLDSRGGAVRHFELVPAGVHRQKHPVRRDASQLLQRRKHPDHETH